MRIAIPDKAALLTALLLDRPLCADCIKTKSGLTEPLEIDETLRRIAGVLVLRAHERGRCRSCGEDREVFALERVHD